jgi:hypothetical protein
VHVLRERPGSGRPALLCPTVLTATFHPSRPEFDLPCSFALASLQLDSEGLTEHRGGDVGIGEELQHKGKISTLECQDAPF